jgi:L-ascorbate metabolism protein UlaG (beta-lactamase superfamily)
LGSAVFLLVTAVLFAPVLVPPFLDEIYYTGPVSDHFDGERFFNPDDGQGEWAGDPTSPRSSRRTSLIWGLLFGDERPEWPREIAVETVVPEPRVEGGRLVVTWVGHATVLVQTAGLNMLTDPIWSDYASPLSFAGPRRVAAPGVRFADLPEIDLVLISHNHYDHLDLPTLGRIWRRDRPLIVTSLGNDRIIAQSGAESEARDWGERVQVRPGIDVIVTRNHHWGSRWFVDRNRALWSSFVLTTPDGNIFFSGDTGPGDMQWPVEAAAYGPVRFAMIPIGAFRFQPGQNWSGSHVGPDHAVQLFERLGAAHALAIHWRTFRLSWEAIDTPRALLAEHLAEAGIPETRFRAVAPGTQWEIPALETAP